MLWYHYKGKTFIIKIILLLGKCVEKMEKSFTNSYYNSFECFPFSIQIVSRRAVINAICKFCNLTNFSFFRNGHTPTQNWIGLDITILSFCIQLPHNKLTKPDAITNIKSRPFNQCTKVGLISNVISQHWIIFLILLQKPMLPPSYIIMPFTRRIMYSVF